MDPAILVCASDKPCVVNSSAVVIQPSMFCQVECSDSILAIVALIAARRVRTLAFSSQNTVAAVVLGRLCQLLDVAFQVVEHPLHFQQRGPERTLGPTPPAIRWRYTGAGADEMLDRHEMAVPDDQRVC